MFFMTAFNGFETCYEWRLNIHVRLNSEFCKPLTQNLWKQIIKFCNSQCYYTKFFKTLHVFLWKYHFKAANVSNGNAMAQNKLIDQ